MKICSTCGVGKEHSEFQIRRASKDGLTASCKFCLSIREAARIDQPKRIAARLAVAMARRSDPDKKAIDEARGRDWAQRNRQKRAAHIIVGNAVRDGLLKKALECERCGGNDQIEAHHEDYAKPLDVVWLCALCHGQRHREINAERRMG